MLVKSMNENGDINNDEIQNCMRVINAAIAAHDKGADEPKNSKPFISLACALEAL